MSLTIRNAKDCHYDLVSLGEIMLRLDPGEGRVRTARQFTAWEGGGEQTSLCKIDSKACVFKAMQV